MFKFAFHKRVWSKLPHYILYISFQDASSIAWLTLLLEILANMYIVITYYLFCDVINFEIDLSYHTIFLHDQKSLEKNLNSITTKIVFNMK